MKQKICKFLVGCLVAMVALYVAFAMAFLCHDPEQRKFQDVHILVKDTAYRDFLSSEVKSILAQAKLTPKQGEDLSMINTALIEEAVRKSPLIDHVECYLTPSGRLNLNIFQRTPILRVLPQGGMSYFLDDKAGIIAKRFPVALSLPLVTGYATEDLVRSKLYDLGVYLQKDAFWNAQIEQINILRDETIELIPRIGDHTIYLGVAEDYATKLERVKKFYDRALSKIGWDKYSRISVELPNQIICTKREK